MSAIFITPLMISACEYDLCMKYLQIVLIEDVQLVCLQAYRQIQTISRSLWKITQQLSIVIQMFDSIPKIDFERNIFMVDKSLSQTPTLIKLS